MSRSGLRAVPEIAPRALGLVRVSKERDGMVSPEVQLSAIGDYCTARGYALTAVVEGLDESGSRAKSAWWPRLDQAVADVEAGDYDVIVVWKFSRTARNRLRWAVAIDRVEQAGGRLESATEQVDVTTSTGRFTRGMLAELNAFEAERIGEVWKEVHARRVASGRPPNGKPKWGYVYDLEEKLHVPDPETGPVLVDLYRRYVAGESVYSLVRWLNSHGWKTLSGGTWSDRTLRRVLDTGFASGHFMVDGQRHRGVHEALIDEKLWQAYLDARHRRAAQPARRERSPYLLSGLVRCARCEGSMVAGQFGQGRKPKYRCKAAKEQGPAACTGGYVMAPFLEAAVLEWLEQRAGQVDVARHDQAALTARRTAAKSDERRLAREVARVEEGLMRLAMQDATQPLPPAVYQRARAELEEQLQQLGAALEEAQREQRSSKVNVRAAARSLLEDWDERPVEHRREALRELVGEVRVLTGRPRAQITVRGVWEMERGGES